MLLLAIVMGAFTGQLTDYWLGRAGVKDNFRIIAAVVVGAIIGILVGVGHTYFTHALVV